MSHNVDRQTVYPDKRERPKQPRMRWKKILRGTLNWAPLWIPIVFLLWVIWPHIKDDCRLKHNSVKTTARVARTYKHDGKNVQYMVAYYYYVNDTLYEGSTSVRKSYWQELKPHDQFEIVYEKGHPANSNWAGYYK